MRALKKNVTCSFFRASWRTWANVNEWKAVRGGRGRWGGGENMAHGGEGECVSHWWTHARGGGGGGVGIKPSKKENLKGNFRHAFILWKCVLRDIKTCRWCKICQWNQFWDFVLITVSPDLLNHHCFKISQTACHREIWANACMCRHERKAENIPITKPRQAKERSLKTSCLEGIGDVMMEIRRDKKAGAQAMRAALAGGMVCV